MDYPLQIADQLRQHLRALRKQRGLTQAQLGLRLGVTQARIVEIERQPGVVSLEQIMNVLAVLGAALVLKDGSAAVSPPVVAEAAPRPYLAESPTPAPAPARKTARIAKPAIKPRTGSW